MLQTSRVSTERPIEPLRGRGFACCLARHPALRRSRRACGSNCLLRCRTAHTAASTSSPRDTFVAERTARQRQPSVDRPVLGHSTGSCAARRTGALRQLHGQGPHSPHAAPRAAIATLAPPSRARFARCAGRLFSGQRCGHHACTKRTGHARRSYTAYV